MELHTLSPLPVGIGDITLHGYPRHSLPHPRLGRSPELFHGLQHACQNASVIHSHSLWMLPNIYPHQARNGTQCKLVISPRGTLSEYARKRSAVMKRFSGWLGQTNTLRKADMFHATSEMEFEDIRACGLKQPVMIIPNGVDLPPPLITQTRPTEQRTLLFLSRIHDNKGVDFLLQAWSRCQVDFPAWNLIIAGPLDGDYPQAMRRLAASLQTERVSFIGEVKGREKNVVYASSDIFVLPTRSENFGIAVAEALAHGTPAICTTGAPWSGLKDNRCGWSIDIGVEPLIDCLRRALTLPRSELTTMGERGKLWMSSKFTWQPIGERTLQAYEWLCNRSDKPSWVIESMATKASTHLS